MSLETKSPKKSRAERNLYVYIDYNKMKGLHRHEPKKVDKQMLLERAQNQEDEVKIKESPQKYKNTMPGSNSWAALQDKKRAPSIVRPTTAEIPQ